MPTAPETPPPAGRDAIYTSISGGGLHIWGVVDGRGWRIKFAVVSGGEAGVGAEGSGKVVAAVVAGEFGDAADFFVGVLKVLDGFFQAVVVDDLGVGFAGVFMDQFA